MTELVANSRKIVFTANTQWYLHNFRRETISALVATGYEVHCAAPLDGKRESLEALGAIVHDSPAIPSRMTPLSDARVLIWYIFLFVSLRPAIVFSFTPKPNVFAGVASRLADVAFVPNVSGLGRIFERETLLAAAVGRAYSTAFGGAKRIVFQNRESRDMFVTKRIVAPGRALELAGSGVDLSHFEAAAMPEPDPFVFLFSGRLLMSKGLGEFVTAARAIGTRANNGRLIEYRIVGFLNEHLSSTMPRCEFDKMIADTPVRYCGPSEDVRGQIAKAHCFVLPSYYGEGVPRSAIEAAACGRPVITTDHPGCRETVVDGKTGFIVAPRDPASLGEAMKKIVNLDQAILAAMGVASRDLAEAKFDIATNVAAYIALAQHN